MKKIKEGNKDKKCNKINRIKNINRNKQIIKKINWNVLLQELIIQAILKARILMKMSKLKKNFLWRIKIIIIEIENLTIRINTQNKSHIKREEDLKMISNSMILIY